ncbi:acyl-CoA dehydratase activase [Clostridium aminobutyricum]|uniref:2-hydroxyglutaryl-CoA dehydratase n=1 Tax=Clostridium aminobutyricum TaxID=33953 RepID=A0A939D8T6_CLOAM|nr:acyl-CoA dehydratase activase [Clostridium aminobutyricum]MBN7773574.1 2-hydroxyglutaryl-CoA dehydratase [Clostridium aminobutyricum]
MYLGIDIGSSSSKVAIVDGNCQLVAIQVINKGTGTGGVEEALENALNQAGITRDQISFTVVTGYGRITYKDADKQITEITCHAKGVSYLLRDIATVIDIGGQDAKVIRLNQHGDVENFVMNEKCAAGTGRFLEVMSRVLGCELKDLSDLAAKSTKEVPISSVCTVFAESEAISRLASGEKLEDVAKGAHVAIAKRVAGMCNRVGAKSKIAMTGGVALNENMVATMGSVLGMEVIAAPHPQAVGAIGAAVIAYERGQKNN